MSSTIDEILPEVLRLLEERAGLNAESLGAAGVAQVLRQRIAASRADSPQDFLCRLVRDPAEMQELLEDLVVPETWFFRDSLAFEALGRYLERWRTSSRHTIRLLSVPCSTGEEVYSLAIALREAGLRPPEFQILGTDLSQRSLEAAQEGRFPSRSFRRSEDTMGDLRARWFQSSGEAWQIRDELRAGVAFRRDNLAQPGCLGAESPFHLVFCRNVLIYFHRAARDLAVGNLQRLLREDGLLFASPAEARIFAEAGFRAGGDCPFVFCHPNAVPPIQPAAQPATRPQPAPLSAPPSRLDPPGNVPKLKTQPNTGQAKERIGVSPEAVSPDSLLEAARQAADGGRLEEADVLCDRVLARDTANVEAHYLKGVVRQALGLLSDAQRSLERALYLQPRHHEALLHLMLLAERQGDQLAAANYRRRAQRIASPEDG